MDSQDAADFQSAHDELVALHANPTVQSIAEEFFRGQLSVVQFLAKLITLPEVATGLEGLVGAGVGVAAGPFGPFAGPAASGLMALALKALEAKFKASAFLAPSTPTQGVTK